MGTLASRLQSSRLPVTRKISSCPVSVIQVFPLNSISRGSHLADCAVNLSPSPCLAAAGILIWLTWNHLCPQPAVALKLSLTLLLPSWPLLIILLLPLLRRVVVFCFLLCPWSASTLSFIYVTVGSFCFCYWW